MAVIADRLVTRLRLSARRWDHSALALLVASVAVLTVVANATGPEWMPPSLVALPLLAGGLVLVRRWQMLLLLGVAAGCLVTLLALEGSAGFRPGNAVVVAATGGLGMLLVTSRERLGVGALRGDTMLMELREQLHQQGELPELPRGWRAELVLRPAGGTGFGGDFLVSSRLDGQLELALVDVSGKGVDAGTRALLLSGALGGLLGQVAPDRFLPSANHYLLRQAWEEGFATAIHVAVDLATGDYLLDSAGHPPAAQFTSGTGLWSVLEAEGPVLGVFDDTKWSVVQGRLRPGDALLLFTDGLVEVPGRDLALGIDRLLGEANRLVISSFEGGATTLIDSVAPNATDDRALLLLWRT